MSRRKWKHREGDGYAVLIGRINGSVTDGFRTDWQMDATVFRGHPPSAHAHARSRGFELVGSDDFNIAAFRNDKLAAVLWMDEIVDDEPEGLAEVAVQIGCELETGR